MALFSSRQENASKACSWMMMQQEVGALCENDRIQEIMAQRFDFRAFPAVANRKDRREQSSSPSYGPVVTRALEKLTQFPLKYLTCRTFREPLDATDSPQALNPKAKGRLATLPRLMFL